MNIKTQEVCTNEYTPSSMQPKIARQGRTEKRIWRNGHWVRPDAVPALTLAWLKGESGNQIRA